MSAPKVAVLIPVYNAAKYLRQAIDSVLRQTMTDFEIVAVDDGSRDESAAILRQYAASDPRVRVISRPNTGIVGALNDAFAASSAPLIARMDGDDECLPERFAAQVQYMDEHPDCVLLGTNVVVMDSDGENIAPLQGLQWTHEEIDNALLQTQWPLIHPTVMMRRDAMEKVGGYLQGTFPHEDHDLFLRLAECGKVAALPQIFLRYRRHPHSVSWDSHSRENLLDIVERACRRRGIAFHPPPVPEHKQESERICRSRLYRSWAWQALLAGNKSTARKYAGHAIKTRPWTGENLRLLACLARGH